jgi:hypothetical protein
MTRSGRLSLLGRLAGAFALSVIVSGAIQQAILRANGLSDPMSALPPLAIGLALMSIVFACVLWPRRSATVLRWTAVSILAAMLVLGPGIYLQGLSSITPGVGGDILYGLALIIDAYFLFPAAFGVPIHWLMLRSETTVAQIE